MAKTASETIKQYSLVAARCPFCGKSPKDHSWGPMRDSCDFRFMDADAFPKTDKVLLLWQNDMVLGVYRYTADGYMTALIRMEMVVRQHNQNDSFKDDLWAIRMYSGMPRAHHGRIARLELQTQSFGD